MPREALPVQESLRQTPVTPCKLIILYMLKSTSASLNTARISEFVLDGDYANFITLQTAVSELTKEGLVAADRENNRTYLSLLPEGENALFYFETRLSPEVKNNIKSYLSQNSMELRDESSVRSNVVKDMDGGYHAELSIKEGGHDLVSISLHAPTEEMAYDICEKWTANHMELYKYLTKELY